MKKITFYVTPAEAKEVCGSLMAYSTNFTVEEWDAPIPAVPATPAIVRPVKDDAPIMLSETRMRAVNRSGKKRGRKKGSFGKQYRNQTTSRAMLSNVLPHLDGIREGLTTTEIARAIGKTPGALGRVLKDMAESGMINRRTEKRRAPLPANVYSI